MYIYNYKNYKIISNKNYNHKLIKNIYFKKGFFFKQKILKFLFSY